MIVRLQHQRSDGDVDTYHLKSGRRYHIGRGSACEVRILDLKLSRKHCAVEYSEGEWRVIDLASTNGCKVDGDQIVGSVPLKVGSQIEIGQTALKIVRILGDDESDDEGEAEPPARPLPAAKHPTPKPTADHPTPKPELNGAHGDTDRHPEPESMPAGDKSAAPLEHAADDWDPAPEPEAAVKTGALVPNAAADAAADKALEAARRAALQSAKPGSSGTGEIQKPGRLATPAPKLPTPPPARAELPAAKPPAEGSSSQYRKTPVPRQPTPLPMSASDIESGPYKSLDPQPPAKAAAAREAKPQPPKPQLELDLPAPAPAAAAQPGTETRRRQKIMPVIVQPMSDDEAATLPVAPPPAAAPRPTAPPPMAKAPEPVAAPAPTPAAKPDAAGDERTFYITVLGRRVGPLTRALARDLKARELKGTLTLKDLDQYS